MANLITNLDLAKYLDDLLNSKNIKDYTKNGLQIEGKRSISKVVTGVSASKDLIEHAIKVNADCVLVHHGYFWKNEEELLIGMKGSRIKLLMQNNINLLSYHLPLDIHKEIGNNALLAKDLGLSNIESFKNNPLIFKGEFKEAVSIQDLSKLLKTKLNREPLHLGKGVKLIKTLALCTGAAQDYIIDAIDEKMDCFITGEVSERTYYQAMENDIEFFSAGHHATEVCGIKNLGKIIEKEFGLDVEFFNSENPV
ncbi:MAG: Nif3-like dinuclear metal center hexameric protein [Psittacicella sp.]